MMEVKHSPATQMEFRSSRNGLSENVKDDLETLFDEDDSKSLTQKTDKCEVKAPILNGISKRTEESSPVQALDDIEIDLDSEKELNDKSAKADSAAEQEDSELYDLDLEPECTTDTPNGEITDSSKVRDTGDDLDTLLSKINDLVEDCMEEPKANAQKPNVEAVVEIADDDLDDVGDQDEVSSEVKSCAQNSDDKIKNQDEEKVEDNEDKIKKQGSTEKEDAVIDSGKSTSEKMDDDEYVFCLDSPLDETRSQGEDIVEAVETVEEDVKTDKEEKVKDSTAAPAEKKSNAMDEDDDCFLIEDDEDEETMMETESAGNEEEPIKETDETTQTESEKELTKEIEKEFSEITDSKSKEEATGSDATSEKINEEDDDIVCLDDSIEEIEEKEEELKEDSSTGKEVEKKEVAKTSEKVEEVVEKQTDTKSVEEEKAAEKDVEKKKEPTVEKDLDVLDTKETPPAVSESTKTTKEEEKDLPKAVKPSVVTEEDDVVILDDDDDQSEATTPPEAVEKTIEKPSINDSTGITDEGKTSKDEKAPEEELSSEKTSILEPSTIISDNSDNARDGVEEKEDNDDSKQTPDPALVCTESNSCSANDSLLKESTKDMRNEIEENSEQPPAKKIRLSQDESNSRLSVISQEETKSNTQDNDEVMEENKPLKRVHSTESLPSDFKKPKTDVEPVSAEDDNLKDSKDVKCKIESKPLPLYPPPKLEPPTIDLSLDFLKRFKKTIHKMTKSDLEELVLQKIVEAIVHKSEFSEMRDLIEKQDKIIAGHRTKITELNKQFRDLEMVHNRVLKDLETKNAQFVMPVKITRAVGLQVFFPAKKFDPTLTPLTPQNTAPVPPVHASRNNSNLNSHSSDRSSHSSPVTTSGHASKSSTSTSSQAASGSNAQQQAPPQRRGCVQKLTPLRPDTPRNSPLNRSVAAGVVSSSTPSPSTSKDQAQKYLNRSGPQKTRVTPVSKAALYAEPSLKVPVTVIQNDATPAEQTEKHRSMATPPYIASKKTGPSRGPDHFPTNKRFPKFGTSDPQSVAQPLPAAATIVTPVIPPSSSVSTTGSSKSAQKSVIDLTDEDDVIPSAASHSSRTPIPAAAQASSTPQPPAVSSGNRPYKVSVVPQQQLQQPKPNPPKQTQQRPNVSIIPKPNGIAIRQPAVPTRYRHPAPLPNQPVQSSNPSWKLPPARPTIRISNLESGIVISWTIEDTAKEKYAESTSYQIYAYQETSGPPLVESWRHVGDVKAMLLPMAVTLTQFQEGQRYYFAVRAVDAHNRCGPFSFAKTWS